MSNITEKQKCIAEQAVYGNLRAIVNNHFNADLIFRIDINGVTLKYSNGEYPLADMSTVKPILRPMSDLTKEITHRGYNDDKPSIPLVELAKINFLLRPQDDSDYTLQNGDYGYGIYFNHKSYRERARCFFLQVYKNGSLQAFSTDIKSHSNKSNTAKHCGLNVKEIVDLLHQWHFDTRNLIATGEAIDVNTLDINPYSVKL